MIQGLNGKMGETNYLEIGKFKCVCVNKTTQHMKMTNTFYSHLISTFCGSYFTMKVDKLDVTACF